MTTGEIGLADTVLKAGGQWGGVCLAGWCYTYIICTHPARTTAGAQSYALASQIGLSARHPIYIVVINVAPHIGLLSLFVMMPNF